MKYKVRDVLKYKASFSSKDVSLYSLALTCQAFAYITRDVVTLKALGKSTLSLKLY